MSTLRVSYHGRGPEADPVALWGLFHLRGRLRQGIASFAVRTADGAVAVPHLDRLGLDGAEALHVGQAVDLGPLDSERLALDGQI